MAKFTTGPWEHDAAHKHGLDAPEVCIDTTVRPTGPVAIVYPAEGIEARERLANARLIAAAPEMYDLIRMTLEACGTATPHPSHSDLLRKVRTSARALLARIDGDDE